jgi:hypothetical protein
MSRTAPGGQLPEDRHMKLQRETIVTILATLVILAAIPFAIVDTIESGRVYLFSSQFLEELLREAGRLDAAKS